MNPLLDLSAAPLGAVVSKVCFKCNQNKPLTDYYTHPQMGDGHLNKCKSCTKSDTKKRANTLSESPAWVKQEQARHREKYHRLGYKELHKAPPARKAVDMARYMARYPEKHIAHALATQVKPVVHGNQLHHWCYAPMYAKDLIELPSTDHYAVHRFIEYDQATMMYRRKDSGMLLATRAAHEAYIKAVLAYIVANDGPVVILRPAHRIAA